MKKGQNQTQEGNKRTCWHCNELWVPGHNLKYKVKKALHTILMQGEEEVVENTEDIELAKELRFITAPGSPEEAKEIQETEKLLVISSHAMNGITGPATFSLRTLIEGKQVVMLVDRESTN